MLTHAPAPSALAFVPFVSVKNMMALVTPSVSKQCSANLWAISKSISSVGPIRETPRVASHSIDGVIELMPTADAENYTFKYVNGYPKNVSEGFQP